MLSSSKNTAINSISWIASLGIVASAMALFVVLSVFSGLRSMSLEYTQATDPDYRIEAKTGKTLEISAQEIKKLTQTAAIENASKVIEERVLFNYKERELVAYIKGVDANYTQVTPIIKYVSDSIWLDQNSNETIVGNEIARKLGLGLFDFNGKLAVWSPKPGNGKLNNPEDAFTKITTYPVGVFSVSEELNQKYVYGSFSMAKNLLGFIDNQITYLEIKSAKNTTESDVLEIINTVLGDKVKVKSRAQLNATLYKMLNTENIVVYLIFTLVIIIALFNLVGALIMMIIDKKEHLKTLYNMGTEAKDIRKIFFFQGGLITVIGGCIGLALGVLLVLGQLHFNWIMFSETDAYPVVLELKNVCIVLATIFTLGLSASFIASKSINNDLLS